MKWRRASGGATGADGAEIRVRTVYPYDGQRDVDLSFAENVVVLAHPAKDASSPWWYGTLVKSGEKGWFPHDYVQEMKRESGRTNKGRRARGEPVANGQRKRPARYSRTKAARTTNCRSSRATS